MSIPNQVKAAKEKSEQMIKDLKDGKVPAQASEASQSPQPYQEPAPMGEVQHGIQPTNPEPNEPVVVKVPTSSADQTVDGMEPMAPVPPGAIVPVDEHNKLRMEYNSILSRVKIQAEKAKAEKAVYDERFNAMQTQILDLMSQVKNFQANIPAGQLPPAQLKYVTDQDKEEFGEPIIGLNRKVAQSVVEEVVAPLQQRLAQQEVEIFIERLKNRVRNYDQVNFDPAFIAWLETTPDGNSGMMKIETLNMAVQARNVAQAAKFFEEWEGLQKGLPAGQKPFNPQSRVAPAKAGQSPAPVATKRTYTSQEYRRIGNDLISGRYKGEEYKTVKAEMDLAVKEGRIQG